MKLNRITLASAALALLLSPAAVAQDPRAPQDAAPAAGEEGIFDSGAFDAASGAASGAASSAAAERGTGAAGGAAKTEYLVGGEALVSATSAFPSDFGGYALSSAASGKLFAKVSVPDYGSLYASYGVYEPFFGADGGDGAAALAAGSASSSPSYALTEFYYSFDFGKLVFVRLGKQLLAWGPSVVWSPVDFANAQKYDFFAPVDLRQGESGLKLFAPIGKANATFFADFSGVDAAEISSRAGFRAARYSARLDATIGGFELGISGLASEAAQAQAGLDFSGDLLGAAVYGELAAAPAYSGYTRSWAASLGLSRSLDDLKRWTFSAEGFFQSAGSDYTGNPAAMSSLPSLYIGKYYGYAALKADELFSKDLASTVSGLANLSDFSYTVSFQEDFSLPNAPSCSLLVSYAGGGENKEFTYLAGDGSLSLTARTLIQF
jgi:hypothetical protein